MVLFKLKFIAALDFVGDAVEAVPVAVTVLFSLLPPLFPVAVPVSVAELADPVTVATGTLNPPPTDAAAFSALNGAGVIIDV